MVSYKRMEEKDAILGRTLLLDLCFPQKNGGRGCHTGQDLVFFIVISYRRMEEKDAIQGRTSLSFNSYKRMEERMSPWTGPRFRYRYFL